MDSVLTTDDGPEASDDEEGEHESDGDGDEAQIKFMPCAVRNLTELELHFATSAAAAAAALPGRRNVFGSARRWLDSAHGSAPHPPAPGATRAAAQPPASGHHSSLGPELTLVKAGATVAFETPEQVAAQQEAEERGGSMHARFALGEEAVTTNCEELVSAAARGHQDLVFELLRRRAAAIGDMQNIHARHLFEQFSGKMKRGARAGTGESIAPWVRARLADQFRHAIGREIQPGDQQIGQLPQPANIRKIARHIEG